LLMPGIDGLTCIKLLRTAFPEVRIAILTALDAEDAVEAGLGAGADAFIWKGVEPAALPAALRQALEKPVPNAIGRAEKLLDSAVEEKGLTEREFAVLQALAQGQSNKEIGRSLWLAEQTVKFHLTNVYRKLGVASRTEALCWAYRHSLAEAPVVSSNVAEQLSEAAWPQAPPNSRCAHVR